MKTTTSYKSKENEENSLHHTLHDKFNPPKGKQSIFRIFFCSIKNDFWRYFNKINLFEI